MSPLDESPSDSEKPLEGAIEVPEKVYLPSDLDRDMEGPEPSHLPPPSLLDFDLATGERTSSVDTRIGMPVSAVDFEDQIFFGEVEVGPADEESFGVTDVPVSDNPDVAAIQPSGDGLLDAGGHDDAPSLVDLIGLGDDSLGETLRPSGVMAGTGAEGPVPDAFHLGGRASEILPAVSAGKLDGVSQSNSPDPVGAIGRAGAPSPMSLIPDSVSDEVGATDRAGNSFSVADASPETIPWPSTIGEFVGHIWEGDCIAVMSRMPADSVSAVICDPPYGLEFMSKNWDGADGFRRSLNANDVGRDNVFGRTSATGPEYRTTGTGRVSGEQRDWHLYQEWTERWAREAIRVLKPGGYLVCAGATRTHHRQWVAIEDAGFEIRDQLMHVFLSGFPKSRDVGKDIDRLAGATPEVTGTERVRDIRRQPGRGMGWGIDASQRDAPVYMDYERTRPSSDEAKEWAGYGSALKPAYEPWLLARKPLAGTLAHNVLTYGTGALNIDATRIPLEPGDEYVINTFDDGAKPFGGGAGHEYTSRTVTHGREGEPTGERRPVEEGPTGSTGGDAKGRWPSNVILTDAAAFDGGVDGVVGGGQRSSGVMKGGTQRSTQSIDYGVMPDTATLTDTYGDSGGVSRIFIIPKAARSEKEPNWHGLTEFEGEEAGNTLGPMAGRGQPGLKCQKCGHWKVSGNPCVCQEPDWKQTSFERPKVRNDHPTVKSLDLMCHLIRLVCPPNGIVLDPFLGSGSTAKAADIEGRQWIGIELDPRYVKIARARLQGTQQGLGLE